jgi:hypothetical protein
MRLRHGQDGLFLIGSESVRGPLLNLRGGGPIPRPTRDQRTTQARAVRTFGPCVRRIS